MRRGHVKKGRKKVGTHFRLLLVYRDGSGRGGAKTNTKKRKKREKKAAHIPFGLLESLSARDRSNFWT